MIWKMKAAFTPSYGTSGLYDFTAVFVCINASLMTLVHIPYLAHSL